MNNKKKMRYVVCLIVILLLVVGVSYALWSTTDTQDGTNRIASNCLKMSYQDVNEGISLTNAVPTSDSKGIEQEGYTFTITNNCDNWVEYNINLEGLSSVYASIRHNLSYLKLALFNNETNNYVTSKIINDYDTATSQLSSGEAYDTRMIHLGSLSPRGSKTFNLKIWLMEDAPNSEQNKQYDSKITMYSYLIKNEVVLSDYVNSLVSSNSSTMFVDDTEDTNTRYMGANPDNYVSFNGELWRIIGVMNNVDDGTGNKESRIKLIRNEILGVFPYYDDCADENWTDNGDGTYSCNNHRYDNNWPNSTINEILNIYYNNGTHAPYHGWMYVASNWQDYLTSAIDFTSNGFNSVSKTLIGSTTYYLGGYTWGDNGIYDGKTMNAKQYYFAEKNNKGNNNPLTWTGTVGLMYSSDYGYASLSSVDDINCRTISLYSHDNNNASCRYNDWLRDSNFWQWTMTPRTDHRYYMDYITSSGYVDYHYTDRSFYLRPVVYLKSDVKVTGGEGTSSKPYTLKANSESKPLASEYISELAEDNTEELFTDDTPDENIRYMGANPDNYVWFNDELWRIIGVMNNVEGGSSGKTETRVKIIRNESLGNYAFKEPCSDEEITEEKTSCSPWHKNNVWEISDINRVLNNYYYNRSKGLPYNGYNGTIITKNSIPDFTNNGLRNSAKSLIETATYYLGGYATSGEYNISSMISSKWYEAEKTNIVANRALTWVGNIGLMVPSDYGYATSDIENCREQPLNVYVQNCQASDWLLDSSYVQWTITPRLTYEGGAAYVANYGSVGDGGTHKAYNIRPVAYLKASVKITGGNGTSNNPFTLGL
ncbi:MAG: hypothetical protein IJ574_05325 [Bacilli bacterium]|nr:hypothetical protein [Bacilli bacterium]